MDSGFVCVIYLIHTSVFSKTSVILKLIKKDKKEHLIEEMCN